MNDLLITIRVQAQLIAGLTGDNASLQEELAKARAELREARQPQAETDMRPERVED